MRQLKEWQSMVLRIACPHRSGNSCGLIGPLVTIADTTCINCMKTWTVDPPDTIEDAPGALGIFRAASSFDSGCKSNVSDTMLGQIDENDIISRGLGDTIAKVTKVTGIDKLVKRFVKGDCGCNKRREQLNKLVPYGSKDANPPDDTTGG